ncbi:MAG: methyltransferase domain-containing protein [Rhodospirillales bacterium]|nr:methyltransferase domain-containing protein [Rhodospirillales bacterium]
MDRTTRLLSGATHATRIIEIGPSHAPIAPKQGGWNARVVDHASQAELRAKYAGFHVDLDAIEAVDYVWAGGTLEAAIPQADHGRFDLLIASHVIEHLPDLAGFLLSAQTVMAADGALSLAVPDKRYCFDYYKPWSTTGDVLAGHSAGRHGKRTAWNHLAYSISMDGAIAWGQHPTQAPKFLHDFADAQAAMQIWQDTPDAPYVDYHAWQFTPASFALIVLELAQLGIIDWHIDTLHDTAGCEFIVLLKRGRESFATPQHLQAARMALLDRTLLEARAQIDEARFLDPVPETAGHPPADSAALRQVIDLLHAQSLRLAELEAVAAWNRKALLPLRAVWRAGQPLRRAWVRLFGGPG